ncbi:Decaprenylphosphoryl-beta-D-ribose oxidase [Xanthomonas sp. GW]|uniref:FAD-binding oxidoreductase n=1 Tax=Xanthomonas sp. GW TaxID=2724121 RepID=UPI00163962E5|nr:FAD-binding oxidoreductase [Xanthomonas sp. GW]QNH22177.1 Decaprenylphosphoryl-beta-D-ribose oxidase [Xanthomonas sp. GW]
MDEHIDKQRRAATAALLGAGAALALPGCGRDTAAAAQVTDIAGIDRIAVARIATPRSVADVAALLRDSRGAISIGGARYSMGGQIGAAGSLHLDLRELVGLVRLDPAAQRIRVRSGMRWRDVQDLIDPHDLAVAVMQSYSNFSVGGSVAVNCHGRYLHAGPIAHTVQALQLVDAQGEVHELDRERDAELFSAAIGGYGGLGVVTEVELSLARNDMLERHAQRVALADYPAFFAERIAADPRAVMHNADLMPPHFDCPLAVTWLRSDAAPTDTRRLVPRGQDYAREQNLIWAASELPLGESLRERYQTEPLLHTPAVMRRNCQASLDARSLEPRTRRMSTYLLQEYFLPLPAFAAFAREMGAILRRHEVNALNVSIRHSPADTVSLLRWAPQPVFSFVLYYKQRSGAAPDRAAAVWTRQLIDAAMAHGGRYYLPYRLHATPHQFAAAYPEAETFARIKRRIDPQHRFRNRLWDKYLPA